MKVYVKIDADNFCVWGWKLYPKLKGRKIEGEKNTKMIKATKMTLNFPKWEINLSCLPAVSALHKNIYCNVFNYFESKGNSQFSCYQPQSGKD